MDRQSSLGSESLNLCSRTALCCFCPLIDPVCLKSLMGYMPGAVMWGSIWEGHGQGTPRREGMVSPLWLFCLKSSTAFKLWSWFDLFPCYQPGMDLQEGLGKARRLPAFSRVAMTLRSLGGFVPAPHTASWSHHVCRCDHTERSDRPPVPGRICFCRPPMQRPGVDEVSVSMR